MQPPALPGPARSGDADPMRLRSTGSRPLSSMRTIAALVLREMTTTHGRSPGGYLWAVVEPVAAIAILSVIFSALFSAPPIGINFALFYATGMLPFQSFNDISNKVAQALNFSRPLLAYPKVTYLDAILARFLLTLLTDLMVAYIVYTGIMLVYETRVIIDIPRIALGFAMAAALGLGIGTLNCYFITAYPVWQRVWGIIMRPMFIISCVLFVFDTIPEQWRNYLWWNPLIHVIGMTRSGFYASYDAVYASPSYVFAVSGITFMLGMVLLRRSYKELLQS